MKIGRSRRAGRTRRWVEACLLVGGLAGVGVWGWSHVRMAMFQQQADWALDRQTAGRPAPSPAPPLANGALVGRLEIPRLKMRAMVREGAGEDTLDVALGHIPGTALPGQTGNVGIAGHRDTLFRGLRNIEKNDVIQLQTPTGSYSYQVESTRIVKPQDVGVLKPDGHPEMTLVTCYPFYYVGSAPDRFIVKARLEAPSAAPETPRRPVVRQRKPQPSIRRVTFHLRQSHTMQLAPEITFGLSSTDTVRRRINAWIRLSPARRTIWLRNQAAYQPVMFHGNDDSRQAELMITGITRNEVTGYLLLFGARK